MTTVTVHIINAFVADDEGGNPAAVVFDADDLDEAQKQNVSTTLGLSETAFVSQSSVSDYKLDFFYPDPAYRPLRARHYRHLRASGLDRQALDPRKLQRNYRWST